MFSVIIPLYNKEKSVSSTLQSVLNQTFKKFEVIVVDDGSTDDSVRVVNQFTDKRIRLIQKENGGVCSARNVGILHAQYDFIASDAADVKEYFKHKFGKHVLLPTGVLNNSSQEGIKQGMVELYALARTKGILGSYYSSFSTAAAMIGNIPKETVSINS